MIKKTKLNILDTFIFHEKESSEMFVIVIRLLTIAFAFQQMEFLSKSVKFGIKNHLLNKYFP